MQSLTNEYRLLRRLGSGGMGEVWEAARIKGEGIFVPCAIKLLHGDFTESARERQLFFDEARIATQLDHSRIVKVTDLGTARDGRPFLVMERVDGVDLRQFLRATSKESDAPLELDVVTYIIGEVLAALDYAHARTVGGSDAGIIHSDVTPGNVLISSSGEVKLTDFGIARLAAAATPMSRAIGTPRYMSPEQLSGEPQRETDIYGLGVILHELLEGKRFLDGLTPDQFRSRVLLGPPPKLTRADVPQWLDELRARMIATDPRQRPSASEARAVLMEHCPRYLAAAARLEADYARLIGRKRSGVTQVFELGQVGDTAILPPPAGAEDEPIAEVTSEKSSSGEIAPTEVLPTTKATSDSQPGVVRWLAISSGLAALGLLVVAITLLVQLLAEPASGTARTEAPRELAAAAKPSSTALPREPASPAEARPKDREPPATTPAPEPPEPALLANATPEPEPEPDRPTEADSPVEPEEAPPDKPKPKAVPKVGVVFLIETNLEGRLKAGRKLVAVKNRSGYAELPPGRYKISWKPEGSDEWQLHGQVTIKDISPSRYKVRLDGGKIVEVGEL